MNVGGESVGVVAECVLDRPEDLFGWCVGEGFGHLTCPVCQDGLEPFQELPDAGLTVFGRGGHGAIEVGHDRLTGGGFASPIRVWPRPQHFAPTFSGRTPCGINSAIDLHLARTTGTHLELASNE